MYQLPIIITIMTGIGILKTGSLQVRSLSHEFPISTEIFVTINQKIGPSADADSWTCVSRKVLHANMCNLLIMNHVHASLTRSSIYWRLMQGMQCKVRTWIWSIQGTNNVRSRTTFESNYIWDHNSMIKRNKWKIVGFFAVGSRCTLMYLSPHTRFSITTYKSVSSVTWKLEDCLETHSIATILTKEMSTKFYLDKL